MIRVAVFASGSGTNFQAIVDYFSDEKKGVEIELLLCNRPNAPVIGRALAAGVNSCLFSKQDLESTDKVLNTLVDSKIDFIVLAGFLLLIPPKIISYYNGRILNIHPALLPKYGGKGMYGMKIHEAVIRSGDRISGITIHMVNEEYDRGSIVSQHTCEISKSDSPDSLAAKIHKLEYYWYPRIIERLLKD